MKVLFYKQKNGRAPVNDFIRKLQPKDRIHILGCLKNVEELGFVCPRVFFRQIKGKLWEIKIRTSNAGYRIFYAAINVDVVILLNIYKKQSQKAPKKEIEIAEKRMNEVLKDEKLYNT